MLMLGVGEKPLSYDEQKILKNQGQHQINSMKILNEFNIDNLENYCYNTIDLRNIFSNHNGSIYYDRGHTVDDGNYIIAKKIFDEISLDILQKINLEKNIIE